MGHVGGRIAGLRYPLHHQSPPLNSASFGNSARRSCGGDSVQFYGWKPTIISGSASAPRTEPFAPWSGPTRPTPPGPRPTTPCPTGASAGRQVRCCNVSMGASVSPCWTKLLTEVRRLAPKYVPVAQLADKRNPFAPPRSTSRPCRSERSWTRPIESRASRQSRQRSRSAWPSLELS